MEHVLQFEGSADHCYPSKCILRQSTYIVPHSILLICITLEKCINYLRYKLTDPEKVTHLEQTPVFQDVSSQPITRQPSHAIVDQVSMKRVHLFKFRTEARTGFPIRAQSPVFPRGRFESATHKRSIFAECEISKTIDHVWEIRFTLSQRSRM